MNAFASALDVLFADPNFGAEATYMGPSGAVPMLCRVIVSAPDEAFGAGLQVNTASRQGEIRVAEIDPVQDGGIVTIAGCRFRVQGAKQPDDQRLVWRFGMVPQK